MLSSMLKISYTFLNRLYPFKQGISLHVTVTGMMEGNEKKKKKDFRVSKVHEILQLQCYIANRIYALTV